MSDIFVSYAKQDRSHVAARVEQLKAEGWSVWWDRELIAGKDYTREIERALLQAKCVMVVWSRHSIDSDWVRTEAAEGKRRGVLVPVRIDSSEQPLEFRQLQCADWFKPKSLPRQLRRGIAALVAPDPDAVTAIETRPDRRPRSLAIAGVLSLVALLAWVFYPRGTEEAPPPSKPTITSFAADPASIAFGESTTLRWQTEDAQFFELDHGIGAVGGGEHTVQPDVTTTYMLIVRSPEGQETAKATVEVRPRDSAPTTSAQILEFRAEPAVLQSGSETVLTWSTTGAVTVRLDDSQDGQSVQSSGSRIRSPLADQVYRLTVTDAAGREASEAITVRVTQPAPTPAYAEITEFRAEPPSVPAGVATTLRWTTRNAVSVLLDDGTGERSVETSGSQSVAPTANQTYRLTAVDAVDRRVSLEVTVRLSAPLIPAPDLLDCAPLGAEGLLVVGAGGITRTTQDGGATWSPEARPAQGANLKSCCTSSDGAYACVVGAAGVALVSTDGGATWSSSSTGTQEDLVAVACSADGLHTWAVGPEVVLYSGDRGGLWRRVSPGNKSARLSTVSLFGSGQVWLGGLERPANAYIPVVKYAPDGGLSSASWKGARDLMGVLANCTVRALAAPTGASVVWAATTYHNEKDEDNRVYRAVSDPDEFDDPHSKLPWQQVSGPVCPMLVDLLYHSGSGQLWGVGPTGVHSSADAASWQLQIAGAFRSLCANPESGTLWAVGDAGLIVCSTDGGGTWDRLPYL